MLEHEVVEKTVSDKTTGEKVEDWQKEKKKGRKIRLKYSGKKRKRKDADI